MANCCILYWVFVDKSTFSDLFQGEFSWVEIHLWHTKVNAKIHWFFLRVHSFFWFWLHMMKCSVCRSDRKTNLTRQNLFIDFVYNCTVTMLSLQNNRTVLQKWSEFSFKQFLVETVSSCVENTMRAIDLFLLLLRHISYWSGFAVIAVQNRHQ